MSDNHSNSSVNKPDTWAVMRQQADQPAKEKILRGEPVLCHCCMQVNSEYKLTSYYCSRCDRGFCASHGNFTRGAGTCMYCGMTKLQLLLLLSKFKKIDGLEAQLTLLKRDQKRYEPIAEKLAESDKQD